MPSKEGRGVWAIWHLVSGCHYYCPDCPFEVPGSGSSRRTRLTILPSIRLKDTVPPQAKKIVIAQDLMAPQVPRSWIHLAITKIGSWNDSRFYIFTKNPERYLEFKEELRYRLNNVVLGAIVETDVQGVFDDGAPSFEKRIKVLQELSTSAFFTAVVVVGSFPVSDNFGKKIWSTMPNEVFMPLRGAGKEEAARYLLKQDVHVYFTTPWELAGIKGREEKGVVV